VWCVGAVFQDREPDNGDRHLIGHPLHVGSSFGSSKGRCKIAMGC
jgi:hypothetical protein